ncbi:putative F-box domain, leucine-rich repeat domain superfamily, F-box-like domain superfamily [Helianthus annuus]|nr:putative F-box domain, leucine-rich repeat domain superfamily, F-box-like domain superfamily [Helianthus annuus]KAJ0654763.1 putative F-box domain, leucine-rich repeat domain superfamily, F-box-like domain superfamily [Helianthus annuus]KAJ0838648.1 putative F-box domain, leucine-rich repeat domain superfamily, F-box-like domain superfamily [Helianthus annuus]
MDSSHDQKRMNVEDDRLSSLPDGLIHKILSFISIKHAIQTSVLSSRWRFLWTSMPYLNFSRDDFSKLPKFSKFVTHVLSDRNNQTEVSSVKLSLHGKMSGIFAKKIIKYAFSHNIQQLNVASMLANEVGFPLVLFSSRSLKHLSLTMKVLSDIEYRSKYSLRYVFNATSTWELPALTTLYLDNAALICDENTDKCIDLFSKCANLKNLTLKSCYMEGFKGLGICLPKLSNLTIEIACGSVEVFNIVAPQLKNLTIRSYFDEQYSLSAPDLVFLFYQGGYCLQLSTDDYLSLEKADICVPRPKDAHQVLRMLQRLHNVKCLTLNVEIVELLSSSVELITNQPSPFANLKSLKIQPDIDFSDLGEHERADMSAEVRSYLLDGSPDATFTTVSREDVRAIKNTKLAQNLITELSALLEQEKASIETKMAKLDEHGKAHVDTDMSWKYLSVLIQEGEKKTSDIISKLKEINGILTELPASNRATIQPSFSTLGVEANIVANKITGFIKMVCDENQRCLNVCIDDVTTASQLSS